MKKNVGANGSHVDLEIITLLVAKLLRDEHFIYRAPTPADYAIAPTGRALGASADLHVNVDLGRGMSIRVDHPWGADSDRDIETLVDDAQVISDKIAELRDHAPEIRGVIARVKAATKREIARAKRRGLPNELVSVAVMPVGATDNEHWIIRVEHAALAQSLKLEPFSFEATHESDVAAAFAGFLEVQISRAERRAALDEMGATGTIDAVVVAAIADAGLDVAEVLIGLRDSDDWTVDVASGGDRRFALHWQEGAVFAQVDLGDGVTWHENRLDFRKATKTVGEIDNGSPLSSFFEHPFLDERLVVRSGRSTEGERATIHCNRALLAFDADSGRIWPV